MIAYTISGDHNLSLVINGKQYNVRKDDKNYDNVMSCLRDTAMADRENALLKLLDNVGKVQTFFQNSTGVEVRSDGVFYQGERVHNVVVDRIFSFMEKNLPFEPLLNFLTKLLQNPSYQSQQQLFYFLEHASLPICEDGDFLAYKAVRSDFMDKYSGKFDNSIGQVVTMPRGRVDDNRDVGCGSGLHAGTLEYVKGYGVGEDKLIIVKINPQDVVSVPSDSNNQKLRTCKYEVLREFSEEMRFELAKNDGAKYSEDEDNDDWCDDEEDC